MRRDFSTVPKLLYYGINVWKCFSLYGKCDCGAPAGVILKLCCPLLDQMWSYNFLFQWLVDFKDRMLYPLFIDKAYWQVGYIQFIYKNMMTNFCFNCSVLFSPHVSMYEHSKSLWVAVQLKKSHTSVKVNIHEWKYLFDKGNKSHPFILHLKSNVFKYQKKI